MASAECFGVKDKEIKRQGLFPQNLRCSFWQILPDHVHLPHWADKETGIPRWMVTCFRVVRKLGLGPAFLDSKTRIYYVMVERKSPHCKPQNSSKDRQSPGGPAKEGMPYSIFLAATTQTIGCSHWVTEQSRHWSGMRDDWSFL